jgi:tellurite resistance protein
MEWAEVRAVAEKALADGKLTAAEREEILAAIMADGEVSPEEMALVDQIAERITKGEIDLA